MKTSRDPRPGTSKSRREEMFQRFYALVDSVPRGQVATYGQIAREAGLPRHARHVGAALRRLPKGTELPWHRVLGADGKIRPATRSGGAEQRRRLREEGVEVRADRVDLDVCGWRPDL